MKSDDSRDLVARQRETIESLTAALRRMHQVLTSIPLGLIVVAENQIQSINSQAQELFQYSFDEVVGKEVRQLFPDLESFGTDGKPLKTVARRKGGEYFPTELFVNRIDVGGTPSTFIHLQDISERQRLEQLKNDFVAMVSHDIRTPLTTVRLFLSLLEEGDYGHLTGKGPIGLVRAQSAIEYLISMVNVLLDSEKIESGTVTLDPQATSPGSIIDRTIINCTGAASEKQIRLISQYPEMAFHADEDRIIQVLMNLLSNAIKFSPDGSQVGVYAHSYNHGITFEVIDQGPGIPEQLQSAIFERYRQLPQSESGKTPGFGLGLSICKGIVELHNGNIWVESQPGLGTKFVFWIPLSSSSRTIGEL